MLKGLTHNTRRAARAYGMETCLKAFAMHECDGEGASTIAFQLRGLKTTQQADAAINAGRELYEANVMLPDHYTLESAQRDAEDRADQHRLPMTVHRTPATYGWSIRDASNPVVHRRATKVAVTVLPASYFDA